jgi:16S rRNA (uracil1498-N3)-methyltransferase
MNYFYHPDPESKNELGSEESFHCVKVLRKNQGDEIDIIDGKGNIFKCRLEKATHRKCIFSILSKKTTPNPKSYYTHVAIAPTKSQDRIEWFVEKACELGVDEISFINTQRTERKKVNLDRIEKKAIGAMKQSKNIFKTIINEIIPYNKFIIRNDFKDFDKFIAFVDHDNPDQLSSMVRKNNKYLILIGPEGDFTNDELSMANEQFFRKVALGHTVLRTETAGIVASNTLNIINQM